MATDPNTARHYNQNAASYHQHVSTPSKSPFHAYYEKPAMRSALPNLGGLEVISIGCGSGVDTRWLSDNGAKRVVGIDISEGLLEIARANNPDIEFHKMDMEKLEFDDGSFDLAYSSLAIHYVDNWIAPLKEAFRVLRPGGVYVFSCAHPIESASEYSSEGDIKYARLGRAKNVTADTMTIYGDYMAREGDGVKPIKNVVNSIDLVVYHRTFSKMVEQIQASGFSIERVIEPEPLPEMEEVDSANYEALKRIPSFIIWVLKR